MTPWKILSTVLAIGFLAAPLIALTLGAVPGLVVLSLALVAILFVGWSARDQVSPEIRPRLRLMMVANGALLALALAGLLVAILT